MKKLYLLSEFDSTFTIFSCTKENDAEKINPLIDKYISAWNTGNLSLLPGVVDSSFEDCENFLISNL